MTVRPVVRLLAGAALIVLTATACGGGGTPGPGGSSPDPATSTTPSGDATLGTGAPTTTAAPPDTPVERMPASWEACDNPPAGYSIGYPGDWHSAEAPWTCQFFHPDPFTIPANSEFPPLALNADQTDVSVATYRDQVTDPAYYTVVRDEDVTVLDRPGVRFETVTLGLGLDEAGVRRYGYIIDSGGGTAFVVWTVAGPDETRYEDWKFTIDIARDSVRFLH